MAGSVVREEHAVKTRRVAVTENLKPADGYTAFGESTCPCLHVSVWGCRPTHARTGRVVHDHLRMRWRIGLHGHVVRDEGTCGEPRLAKQG